MGLLTPQDVPDDDVDAMARHIIDVNHYLVLGTTNDDGSPRVSPVYFGVDAYADFYWISSIEAQHSKNVEARPPVSLVIFDSTVAVGQGRAVYVTGSAQRVPDDELAERCAVAFRPLGGGRAYGPEELSGDEPFRLYVARADEIDVHIPGRHPVFGTGIDRRMPAHP